MHMTIEANPYTKKLPAKAYEEGWRARREGKFPEDCPHGDYPRQVRKAWMRGYDESADALRVEHQEAPVQTLAPPPVDRRDPTYFLPEGVDHPGRFVRPRPVPCPGCRRIRLDNLSQAVYVRAYSGGQEAQVVYLVCRACDHRFQLPVRAQ